MQTKIFNLLLMEIACLHSNLYAQKKTNFKNIETIKKDSWVNSIGVSIPIIWNNSEGTYYSLRNRREPNGKAFSYGIDLNYSRTIYKNIFGIVGIGYFKQVFGIKRPFAFKVPNGTEPLADKIILIQ